MSKPKKARLGAYAGLDLSLAGTGGVLLDAKGEVVSVLAFSSTKKEVDGARKPYVILPSPPVSMGNPRSMWKRTVWVASKIYEWMETYAEPACLVGIEDHAYGAKGTSIYQLGHLHGMVRRDLQDCGKHWLLIGPTELKSAVTGAGKADKKAMMSVPTPKLDQSALGSSTRHNVVDAYWLARLAMAYAECKVDSGTMNALPETFINVLKPHAKRQGLLARELLP